MSFVSFAILFLFTQIHTQHLEYHHREEIFSQEQRERERVFENVSKRALTRLSCLGLCLVHFCLTNWCSHIRSVPRNIKGLDCVPFNKVSQLDWRHKLWFKLYLESREHTLGINVINCFTYFGLLSHHQILSWKSIHSWFWKHTKLQ